MPNDTPPNWALIPVGEVYFQWDRDDRHHLVLDLSGPLPVWVVVVAGALVPLGEYLGRHRAGGRRCGSSSAAASRPPTGRTDHGRLSAIRRRAGYRSAAIRRRAGPGRHARPHNDRQVVPVHLRGRVRERLRHSPRLGHVPGREPVQPVHPVPQHQEPPVVSPPPRGNVHTSRPWPSAARLGVAQNSFDTPPHTTQNFDCPQGSGWNYAYDAVSFPLSSATSKVAHR
jgi:hypothetical protein